MTTISEDAMAEAFPDVDPEYRPYGSRVLVQIRTPITKTKGGIILTSDTVDTEKWNTQVGKVLSLGPVSYKNRNTLEPWPEGEWCQPGTFVRVPKYGGDRWEVTDSEGRTAMFVVFNDLDIGGEHTGNPLQVKAFI